TITVSGLATGAEDGQLVAVALKTADGATTLQTMTATVSGGAWHIDLPPGATPAFPDGPYLVTANVSDAAGNAAAEATRPSTADAAVSTPSPFGHIGTVATGAHGGSYAMPGVNDGYAVEGIGDFNGDGTDDILWRNSGTGQLDAWIMQNGHVSQAVDLGSH